MRLRPLSLMVAASLALTAPPLAGSAAAQDGYGPESRGGPGDAGGPGGAGGHGMRRGMRGHELRASLDPVVLEGPPAPAEFARIVELPEDQVGRYAQLYERFMASTRPQRDSLTALRRDLRSAFEQGDREAARQQAGQLRPLTEDLQRRQATFDDTLQPLLEKDQWKRYQHWRDDERKRAQKDRQERRLGPPGDEPPA
jgi:hypothetical protein